MSEGVGETAIVPTPEESQGNPHPECIGTCGYNAADREAAMVVVQRADDGTPTVWCDPCIEPLVRALNDAGLPTIASCCGHRHRPGRITLADGRELLIVPDYDTAQAIDRAFPTDINGDQNGSQPPQPSCPTCNAPVDALGNCLGSCAGEEWEQST